MHYDLKQNHKKKIDKLFINLNKLVNKNPFVIVIILHEYYRNLYFHDPFIKLKPIDPIQRFNQNIEKYIQISEVFLNNFGFYKFNQKNKKNSNNIKKVTGDVYGKLWERFSKKNNQNAKKLLKNRIGENIFKNKIVLDAGCGGGRYSAAISSMGASKVFAVDYGSYGLKVAKKNFCKDKKIIFKKADILNLPFKKNFFDVVFSNGVIHHSENVIKGLSEIVRVCKPGGMIWLYLYSTGGIFWYSRYLMNKLFKKIPYDYTLNALDMINVPSERFIFMDNWYVPIENHLSHEMIENSLKKLGVSRIEKKISKNKFDLDYAIAKNHKYKNMFGEGEIRFLIKK